MIIYYIDTANPRTKNLAFRGFEPDFCFRGLLVSGFG